MADEQPATIEIVWHRSNDEASYHLTGLSHVEAQRVLLAILQDNFENAVTEAAAITNAEDS